MPSSVVDSREFLARGSTSLEPASSREPKKHKRLWNVLTIVVSLLAALSALVYYLYRTDLGAAEARVSSASKLIDTPCGSIEFADVGVGTPVLAVHGAGGGFDQALEIAAPLIGAGFRLIAPSRFGYLRTPKPSDASPIAQANAYVCLLNALEVRRVVVFGGSAGAPSAMQFCLRHGDRCAAMVLAVPLAYSGGYNAPSAQRSAFTNSLIDATISSDFIFWSMSKMAHDTTVETILGTPSNDIKKSSRDEQARIERILESVQPVSRRKEGLRNDSTIAQSLTRNDLEHFTVPTLIFGVENDLYKTYNGARYTAEHIPGARFIGYPTGGHLWVGHQKEAWSDVLGFLAIAPNRNVAKGR